MRIIALIAATLFAATSLHAQLYSYRNEDGKLVITDRPIRKDGYKLVKTYIPKRKVEEAEQRRSSGSRSKYVLSPSQIEGLVDPIAQSMSVDPDLVKAVIEVESSRDMRAKSHKGAMGLMQLIPDTAKRFGVDDPWDPRQNIRGGIRYLQYLLSYFAGDVDLVLAAYNAGENAVDRHGGVPPYRETRNYIRKVRLIYTTKDHPYGNAAKERSVLVSKRARSTASGFTAGE